VLVSGPVELPDVSGVRMIRVTTAAEMALACKAEFENCDAAILTAAVCDYSPALRESRKRKKGADPITVTLEPTEDIAASLGRVKGPRILIGFAMDDHEAQASAEAKLRRKNCDAIVQNGPENIGAARVCVTVLWQKRGWGSPMEGTKAEIATYLISMLENIFQSRSGSPEN
jgi:phosphopantothenoylcysteine decarboxylase/phosphopantothenate--cysteine ligase